MKGYIVTQTTDAGKHKYAVLAVDEDAAIREVDRVFGIPCASYSVSEFTGAKYVASSMKKRN